ncbi:RING finger protein B-like [Spea bombifrons]|uniref:RING finger protein B-like n=1 Tax=Spea bombifrons TaxID=233779 RepID=UPI00234BC512|nr:RING finger protein B-like [Spea bombifrons]
MALASGHWLEINALGDPPRPRHGHALAVAGNIAFIFGGCTRSSSRVSTSHSYVDVKPIYLNDFYMLTINIEDSTWEVIPQTGHIPSPREGHCICLVKRKIYLFGGRSDENADECLPGIYSFDVGTLTWEKLKTNGTAPQTLDHSVAVVGENIFVFGGHCHGKVVDDLFMFNTVSESWVPVKASGSLPDARTGHVFAAVGEQIYMFGGCSAKSVYYTDVYVLDTASLEWKCCEVKGEKPSGRKHHSFTAHHDKDIYLFGGVQESGYEAKILNADVMKLSLAKMKWKVPLYFGIPPECRYKHTTFILHSQLYVFGGKNEENDLNDLMRMKLINPSERQPIMKDILLECGIQGVSNGFTPTKIPKVKYQLPALQLPRIGSPLPDVQDHSFISVRKQAMEKITAAFLLLDTEFEQFDLERARFAEAKSAFQQEKEAFHRHYKAQKQEIQEMLEKHRLQNEAWLKARAEENDKERKEICKLREEIFLEQKKLKEEQQIIEKRNQQLISIMQQFKGM